MNTHRVNKASFKKWPYAPTALEDLQPCVVEDTDGLLTVEADCYAAFLARTAERLKREGPPPRGLGDTVAKVLRAVGVKRKCGGCAKRQAALNKIVPYG